MKLDIEELVRRQRDFFNTGCTTDISYRMQALKKLYAALKAWESRLNAALKEDLNKSVHEAYMCETGLTMSELGYMIKHMKKWSRRKHVRTPLAQFAAKSFVVKEPYGVTLVMSPWNYPVLLTLEPLIGAIAAGNCCIIKPSAYSPATSAVIKAMISDIFPEEYVAVVLGGRKENSALLDQKFDYIFFTGGVSVGKLVMEKASKHLTPVTLELGGKSPCIVDHTADIKMAAKRIVFGKYLNCGQTCVAPDYILAEKSIKDELVDEIIKQIRLQYGDEPLDNKNYGKMINEKHYNRVMGLIDKNKTVTGGYGRKASLQIAPAVLDGVTENDAVMQEEIFGPVLPVIEVSCIDKAYEFVKSRPEPLALYLFTSDFDTEKRFLNTVPFGGGCVNDTIIHLATSAMGFGGVGNSGMGSYHGKKSFDTFSHEKSIVKKYTWLDLPMRYQPYKKMYERLIRMFIR